MSHLNLRILVAVFLCFMASTCRNLKEGEIAKIRFESSGCFGAYKTSITIYEKEKLVFAKLQSEGASKTVHINASDLNQFQTIIAALKKLEISEGCTSSRRYIVETGSESFIRKDEGCQDTGFEYFQREVFEGQN